MKVLQERSFPRGVAIAVAMFFAAVFGMLSVELGQDANWDLKNYHLYNAYGLLHGRLKVDLAAAAMQSFFNPLLDLQYYFLSFSLFPNYPRIVAFVMGINSALLALAVVWIAFYVF